MLNYPLMSNNIKKEDIQELIHFLEESNIFTQNRKVREFEEAWSEWLGVKYSVFVNSGSSANFMTMAGIAEMYGKGEIITSPIGWSSDVSSIISAGHTPVFTDVVMTTFAMNEDEILKSITENTKAVLLTHVLGIDGLSDRLIRELQKRNIILIEDVCESHGAMHGDRKAGTFGLASNFSFYYAHHMSTIEGGMICTNDREFYRMMLMYRSHGMLRESRDEIYKEEICKEYPELHPEFIFMVPGYNMRSTEINAVIGLNQLGRLDNNIAARQKNFNLFLDKLDSKRFYTDFKLAGQSNYAFIIMLRDENPELFNEIVVRLQEENVEFRRGTAGGGNLARQPFVRKRYQDIKPETFKNAEHIHKYGIYTGNYPDLDEEKIVGLSELLNHI